MPSKSQNIPFPPLQLADDQWGFQGLRHLSGHHHAVQILEANDGSRLALKRVKDNDLMKRYDREAAERMLARVNRTLRVVDKVKRLPGLPEIAAPFPLSGDAGQFVLMWEGHGYCLMPCLEGRQPSYRRFGDVRRVLRALGQLHLAGQDNQDLLANLEDSHAAPSLQEIFAADVKSYERTLIRIQEFDGARLLKRILRSRMDLAAELIALARAIMERGVESDFRQTLLHGDSCAGNFVFSECRGQSKERVEKCAILDVETFKRGSRAQDLIVPFSIHCAHGGFQRAHVERLLSSYEGEHPLSEGERDYLYAHLALPRHWLRIARRLLKGSRAWWSPLHLQKLRYALKRLPSQKRLAESILGR